MSIIVQVTFSVAIGDNPGRSAQERAVRYCKEFDDLDPQTAEEDFGIGLDLSVSDSILHVSAEVKGPDA